MSCVHPRVPASRALIRVASLALAAAAVSAGSLPAAAEEACRLSSAEQAQFLPNTAAPQNLRPLADPGQALPDDCGFYKWAWEAFLNATQTVDGKPRFLAYPTFEDVFNVKESPLFPPQRPGLLSVAPRRAKVSNRDERARFAQDDLLQAGTREVLIDRDGHAIWYAIHLNRTYKAFVDDYRLNDLRQLDHIPPDLTFRTGSLELKSAWKIVEGPPPANYITTKALVPIFKTDASGQIVKDGDKSRVVTLALLGIHVVGTIEGHPEFIWSTFEHVSHERKPWTRDVAPAAKTNPDKTNPDKTNPDKSDRALVETVLGHYALYPAAKGQAPPVDGANNGNVIFGLKLDAKRQTFTPRSAIYRVFPGSKSDDSGEDDAVTSLNGAVQTLFERLAPADVRSNYQLVGAIWLNQPEQDFKTGVNFLQAAKAARKVPLFGGEDRLSSTTMESFTQEANSLPNCLSCHNTEGVSGLQASRLNVSHALSKFYSIRSEARR